MSNARWFNNVVELLEQSLKDGHITQEEFNREMRVLFEKLDEFNKEAAQP